jgi:hypothetical protein
MGEEMHKETSRANQWRELDDGCQQEPSDTLPDRNHVSRSRELWITGTPLPYLFPNKASESKCARTVTAHAKQANEHDDQLEDVGNKHGDDRCPGALDAGCTADT